VQQRVDRPGRSGGALGGQEGCVAQGRAGRGGRGKRATATPSTPARCRLSPGHAGRQAAIVFAQPPSRIRRKAAVPTRIVTAAKADTMTAEEHARRGEAADRLWQELVKCARV
jgi:hypothetical protein